MNRKKTFFILLFIVWQGFISFETERAMAAESTNNNKAIWIHEAFDSIVGGKYPRIAAINYWHENFPDTFGIESELRIDSSEDALIAYQEGISPDLFINTPTWNTTNPAANKLISTAGSIYHSAYPDFGDMEDDISAEAIDNFEQLAKKPITWVYFSNNWFDGIIKFPLKGVQTILGLGKIPYIRLMARSDYGTKEDPNFSMQNIIDGVFDDQLLDWVLDAKNTNSAMIVEFGTEVNGDWFSWNGKWNGAGEKNGYGDPTMADGPERFIDAYRHIIDLCRDQNCLNLTWVYHVNADSFPEEDWNSIAAYYPGDDYIDWIGVSVYGPQTMWEQWDGNSFKEIMDRAYPQIAGLSDNKSLALLEFGVNENAELGMKIIISGIIGLVGLMIGLLYIFKRKKRIN